MARHLVSQRFLIGLWGGMGLLLATFPLIGQPQTDKTASLYLQAKRMTIALKWDEAIRLFSELVEGSPGSPYEDDARFWIGYCLEKKGDRPVEAFMAYAELLSRYPNSPRTQDAVVHQIFLAETLVREGREAFRPFLIEKLSDPNPTLRNQAALALGRLEDFHALPVLGSMVEDLDWGEEARLLVERLRQVRQAPSAIESKARKGKTLEFGIRAEKEEKPIREESFQEKWDDRFFTLTERHQYYRDLLRDDEKWTQQALIDFGMWTILPTEEYAAYVALTGYDKKEWFRKYWTLRDPTPTTEENEALEEFYRRIAYAHRRYGECWNNREFQYLKDQYLVAGWPHAPWDSRGELYVKYGEPNHVTIGGWQKEEWQYDRYSIDFTVSRYMTNIYQKAIEPGPLSQALYPGQEAWFRSTYILKPEFRYEHPYEKPPMQGVSLRITRGEAEHFGEVQITYTLPIKNLEIQKEKERYAIQYLRHLVVLDEALHVIRRDENVRIVTGKTKKELTAQAVVEETLSMRLATGSYRIALRIEDVFGKRQGLYVEHFTVVAKQGK